MDGEKIAEILYAEFGLEEFLTRRISPDTMARLVELMGIRATGHRGRNTQVGKGIGALDGTEYALHSGQRVKFAVERPPNGSLPRRFRLELAHLGDDTSVGSKVKAGPTAIGLTFDVVLTDSGYGYSVSCPALLGCHTQGLTEEEALENVREAITGWLKCEVQAVQRRAQNMMDEYNAAGYPSKMAVVSVPPVD